MNLRPLAILLTLPLFACASQPGGGGMTTAHVIETPFYAAFKLPGCLAAAPILGPAAIASAIVPFQDSKEGNGWTYLQNGVNDACGGPWTATR